MGKANERWLVRKQEQMDGKEKLKDWMVKKNKHSLASEIFTFGSSDSFQYDILERHFGTLARDRDNIRGRSWWCRLCVLPCQMSVPVALYIYEAISTILPVACYRTEAVQQK